MDPEDLLCGPGWSSSVTRPRCSVATPAVGFALRSLSREISAQTFNPFAFSLPFTVRHLSLRREQHPWIALRKTRGGCQESWNGPEQEQA